MLPLDSIRMNNTRMAPLDDNISASVARPPIAQRWPLAADCFVATSFGQITASGFWLRTRVKPCECEFTALDVHKLNPLERLTV